MNDKFALDRFKSVKPLYINCHKIIKSQYPLKN